MIRIISFFLVFFLWVPCFAQEVENLSSDNKPKKSRREKSKEESDNKLKEESTSGKTTKKSVSYTHLTMQTKD